jgi:hypothetical protein
VVRFVAVHCSTHCWFVWLVLCVSGMVGVVVMVVVMVIVAMVVVMVVAMVVVVVVVWHFVVCAHLWADLLSVCTCVQLPTLPAVWESACYQRLTRWVLRPSAPGIFPE